MEYYIPNWLTIPALANPRYSELSGSELRRCDYRTIGGDRGDLRFRGFLLDEEAGETALVDPVLVTGLVLSDEDACRIAQEVLSASFESIGAECVEHS